MSLIRTTPEDRASPYGRTFEVQDAVDRDGTVIIGVRALVRERNCTVRFPTIAGVREFRAEVGHFLGDVAQVNLKISELRASDLPFGTIIEIVRPD